jgi:hypothetical protein
MEITLWSAVVRKAEVAAAASFLLVVSAVVYLWIGPIYQTAGESCTSSGSCVTFSGTKSLGWDSVLSIPLIASGLVLAGVLLKRWSKLSLPITGLGCLGLAVITFLGVFSIGVLLLPADVAALVAMVWIRERRAVRSQL